MIHALDILVVTSRPDFEHLDRLLDSLTDQVASPFAPRLSIIGRSRDEAMRARMTAAVTSREDRFGPVRIVNMEHDASFARAMNRLLHATDAPHVLFIDPDAWLARDALAEIARFALDDPQAAAWELRRVPYEHPKEYDPVTLTTPWVSAFSSVWRRSALMQLDGFEEVTFTCSEDVDLSWRLRCMGWKLRYVPRAVAVCERIPDCCAIGTEESAGRALANLYLRARFGTWLDVAKGLRMLVAKRNRPLRFARSYFSLARILVAFCLRLPRLRRGGWGKRTEFSPTFVGSDYAQHRDGEAQAWVEPAGSTEQPLVSILLRTHQRTAFVYEALKSVAHQTYRNIEAVVVEDGPPNSRDMVESEFAGLLDVRYFSTGKHVGRACAGNLALAEAKGEWLNFLDDDDLLFADHIEVLLAEARRRGLRGVYGTAWETPTRVLQQDPLRYEEVGIFTRFREDFDRIALWHHHYIPIQAALFHRSLYERYGGFAEDMEQLEDWNLWTRYTLHDDFALVRKTTSKYRVPADQVAAAARYRALGEAYPEALARQREIVFEVNPRLIAQWVELHIARQYPLATTPPFTSSSPKSPVTNSRLGMDAEHAFVRPTSDSSRHDCAAPDEAASRFGN
jgi:GT2 family glycosyltransferase